MKISTSILSAPNKIEAINKLNNTNTDYIHFDIMDGLFVNNKAFSIDEISKLASICNKKIDAHFMVKDPLYYLNLVSDISFEYFTFHIEIDNIDNIITEVKKKDYKVGLSIKPNTDINKLTKYLDDIDLILVMSVEPGFGGQTFIENTYNRIEKIIKLIGNRDIKIEVDGGINDKTIKKLDADIVVVGSFITNSDNYQERINTLKFLVDK